jgi:hypothetical protein
MRKGALHHETYNSTPPMPQCGKARRLVHLLPYSLNAFPVSFHNYYILSVYGFCVFLQYNFIIVLLQCLVLSDILLLPLL